MSGRTEGWFASAVRSGAAVRESTGWLLALATLFGGGVVAMWFGFSLVVGYAAAVGSLLAFVVADYLSFLSGVFDHGHDDRGFLRSYLAHVREFREGRVLYLDSYSRALACVVLGLLGPVAFVLPVPLLARGATTFVCLLVAALLFSAAPLHAYARIPEASD
jgi:hypothetical protein